MTVQMMGGSYVIVFYASFNQQKGPFDYSALEKMKSECSLSENSLVWKKGMEGWVKAGTVQELEMLFLEIPEIPNLDEDSIPAVPEEFEEN